METTKSLIDFGLIESYSQEAKNEEIEIRFRMLQSVKEYASNIFLCFLAEMSSADVLQAAQEEVFCR